MPSDSKNVNLSRLWETEKDRVAWSAAVHGVAKSWAGLSNNSSIMWVSFNVTSVESLPPLRRNLAAECIWTQTAILPWASSLIRPTDFKLLLIQSQEPVT